MTDPAVLKALLAARIGLAKVRESDPEATPWPPEFDEAVVAQIAGALIAGREFERDRNRTLQGVGYA